MSVWISNRNIVELAESATEAPVKKNGLTRQVSSTARLRHMW